MHIHSYVHERLCAQDGRHQLPACMHTHYTFYLIAFQCMTLRGFDHTIYILLYQYIDCLLYKTSQHTHMIYTHILYVYTYIIYIYTVIVFVYIRILLLFYIYICIYIYIIHLIYTVAYIP